MFKAENPINRCLFLFFGLFNETNLTNLSVPRF
jgi:hypothetical protein